MLVAFAGLCGSGKTTLTQALLGPIKGTHGQWTVGEHAAALGRYDDSVRYKGVDSLLTLGVGDALLRSWSEPPSEVGLHIIDNASRVVLPRDCVVIRLAVPIGVAMARRAQRGGRPMPLDWWMKVVQRTERSLYGHKVTEVDATQSVDVVMAEVAHILSAVTPVT
jgi:thymidylate kinase